MKHRTRDTILAHRPRPTLFWSLICLAFVSLVAYRVFFVLPVWFDEIVAKAFVFGLPFLIYAKASKQAAAFLGINPKRFWLGAYLGLALGGAFGFVAMMAGAIKSGGNILIPNLFFANDFWWTFFLGLATAWWESLFFYGLILNVFLIARKSEWEAAFSTTGLFVIFHLPILILRGNLLGAIVPAILLALFAFGQAVIFIRFKSLIGTVVSHAIWGMALLVYTLG